MSDLREAADRLDRLAARTTPGDWRAGGLLASRPEVVAHRDGATEHVAEARQRTGEWITALSPAVAPSLGALLRALADGVPADDAAAELAAVLIARLP